MEELFKRLCHLHPVAKTIRGSKCNRWNLVLSDYSQIRNCVYSNFLVSTATGLQLYEVNTATLTQWYQKYEKARETAVLKQNSLPLPSMTTPGTAPPPRPQATVPTAPGAPSFEFRLPADPTGTAEKVRGAAPVRILVPKQPVQLILPNTAQQSVVVPQNIAQQLVVVPQNIAQQSIVVPQNIAQSSAMPQPTTSSATTSATRVPRSTLCYRRKKEAEARQGDVPCKRYRKRDGPTMCRQCNQVRDPERHKQYNGKWWCQTTSSVSYERWRSEQVARKRTKN